MMPHRRATLIDGMILVAATAVGLAMMRACDPEFTQAPSAKFLKAGWGRPACLVAAWSLALIFLRARRPRPMLRHMLLRPGMAASFAVALAAIIALSRDVMAYQVLKILRPHTSEGGRSVDLFNTIWSSTSSSIPWVVGGAWITLLVMGRWRPASGWIERWGRILGFYWRLHPLISVVASAIVRLFPFLD